ncbi:hypothetical protein VM1G_11965 [Cytospora mali]|uniref:Uncharacterized protein n=1 Tax=Cytospora mali TaxID=578113 RepID=A0A194WCD0_CYTMA|nr:hypothetical protein VM1G_11965 [Valsa mali]
MATRTILAALGIVASRAFAAYGTNIEFCTDSVYAPGAFCPEDQPASGSGTCYNLTVKAGTCYTFDNFPGAPSALIGNVNYANIAGVNFSSCGFYRTQNCTVGPSLEWDSLGAGSYDLTCRYHLASDIESWVCS